MRLPVWLPACLLLAGCASAQGVPAWSTSWLPPADYSVESVALAASSPASALPVADTPLDRALLSLQQGQGWGQPQGQGWGQQPERPPYNSARQSPPASQTKPGLAGDPSQDFSRNGVYLGFAGITGWEILDSDVGGDELGTQDTSGFGMTLGYRFNKQAAVELAYSTSSFSDTATFYNPINDEYNTLEVKGGFYDVAAQVKLFLATGRAQPYGIIGLGMLKGTEGAKDSGFLFRFGLGLDVYLVREVALFTEFRIDSQSFSNADLPDGMESDVHFALLFGILFRF